MFRLWFRTGSISWNLVLRPSMNIFIRSSERPLPHNSPRSLCDLLLAFVMVFNHSWKNAQTPSVLFFRLAVLLYPQKNILYALCWKKLCQGCRKFKTIGDPRWDQPTSDIFIPFCLWAANIYGDILSQGQIVTLHYAPPRRHIVPTDAPSPETFCPTFSIWIPIPWAKLARISGISWIYLGQFLGISAAYM